jgi:ketosteroid isomerase-like protein
MASTATADELVELERRYWQALKDQDVEAAARMTDDPCLVTGAQGASRVDRNTFVSMMSQASWKLNEFDLRDVDVLLFDDVAIVAYTVREQLTVDGTQLNLEAADASTWVRHGDTWLCALHTESLLGDPFGRDRRAATA